MLVKNANLIPTSALEHQNLHRVESQGYQLPTLVQGGEANFKNEMRKHKEVHRRQSLKMHKILLL